MRAFERTARRYWAAEETRDIGEVESLYGKDAILSIPEYGCLSGWQEIKRFYENSIMHYPMLSVTISSVFEKTDEQGAIEWRSIFRDANGKEVALSGVNCLVVSGELIKEMRVYYDSRVLS